MQQFWANFWRIWNSAGPWLLSPVGSRLAVITLLGTQAGLLAYSATRHSPTFLEPAFLAAGISHWQLGRFELYRVNPPLVRMVAALPVLAIGCETDWSRFYDGPGSRAEFPVGEDFIKANGPRSIELFIYARWACIPIALIGGYFAYRWAEELYGGAAGLFTLLLWTFEPNLLAHAELITPDSACTSFGVAAGYWFWKWLRTPTWTHVGLAGFFLGLAELSKMSWLILFGLWPTLWLVWRWFEKRTSRAKRGIPSKTDGSLPSLRQLVGIKVFSLYLINLGYAFDGSLMPLKEFQFVSTALTGLQTPGMTGNRFQSTFLGELSIPVPRNFVLGFDSQKRDFEDYEQPSYLRGEWKDNGWWYYYLYGLLVKVPCGILGILALVTLRRFVSRVPLNRLRDELVLLAPAVSLLLLVSSQTEINQHVRYVFPALGLLMVFLGQAMQASCLLPLTRGLHPVPPKNRVKGHSPNTLCFLCLATCSVASTIHVYPHHLAYFNEMAGGTQNGWRHLLGSNFEWGQSMFQVAEALKENDDTPLVLGYPSPYPLSVLRSFDAAFSRDSIYLDDPEVMTALHSQALRIITSPQILLGSCGCIPGRHYPCISPTAGMHLPAMIKQCTYSIERQHSPTVWVITLRNCPGFKSTSDCDCLTTAD